MYIFCETARRPDRTEARRWERRRGREAGREREGRGWNGRDREEEFVGKMKTYILLLLLLSLSHAHSRHFSRANWRQGETETALGSLDDGQAITIRDIQQHILGLHDFHLSVTLVYCIYAYIYISIYLYVYMYIFSNASSVCIFLICHVSALVHDLSKLTNKTT